MYCYDMLNVDEQQIRLLVLKPLVDYNLEAGASVQCSLRKTLIHETPYRALSYVWGDPKLKVPILLDGFTIYVTQNLNAALRHLRHPTNAISLWVDSICINQEDKAERSQQVNLMDQIYRGAELVLAWLGTAADGSNDAMDAIESIGSYAHQYGFESGYNHEIALRWSQFGESRQLLENTAFDPLIDLFLKICGMSHIVDLRFPVVPVFELFQRPWWQRVWIIQEIVLAKDVIFICGKKQVAGRNLIAADGVGRTLATALSLQESPNTACLHSSYQSQIIQLFNRPPVLLQIRRAWQEVPRQRDNNTFSAILAYTTSLGNSFEATDPRDKIFALLGIASDRNAFNIRPNYELSCQDVYIQATKELLSQGDVRTLTFSGSHKSLLGLPSWVPDWSSTLQTPIYFPSDVFRAGYALSTFSRKMILGFKYDADLGWILRLTGGQVDKVLNISQTWHEINRPLKKTKKGHSKLELETMNWITRMVQFTYDCMDQGSCNDSHQLQQTQKDYQNCIASVIKVSCTGQERNEITTLAKPLKARTLTKMCRAVDSKEPLFEKPDIRTTFRSMEPRCKHRRIFMTKKGYLGIGVDDVHTDDILVIIYGVEIPFIIREHGHGMYQLVGECYIERLMDDISIEDIFLECFQLV